MSSIWYDAPRLRRRPIMPRLLCLLFGHDIIGRVCKVYEAGLISTTHSPVSRLTLFATTTCYVQCVLFLYGSAQRAWGIITSSHTRLIEYAM